MDRNQTLGLTQLPPDDEVEDEEGDEGEEGGSGDPGPGRVPHDVVLGQSQLGRSDERLDVEATVTGPEVQAVRRSLSLEELGEVEEDGDDNRRNDVTKCPFEVTHQPAAY